jgi:hypothetical protein
MKASYILCFTFFTFNIVLGKPKGGGASASWLIENPIIDLTSIGCTSCSVANLAIRTPTSTLCMLHVTTPLLEECEDDTHTPEMGTWESFETSKTLELDFRGQNTLPWGVLHVIGKLLKCRCRKWPHMSHLDIFSTSYGKKKGQESNWQFDSRPLKFRNRPDPGVCRWSATHRWKALKESYKFAWNLIPIKGLSKELWTHKVLGVQTETVSELLLWSPGTKS